jgi:hypothetical protein
MLVSDAVLIMIERGFATCRWVAGGKILGVFSVRDALPREIGTAVSRWRSFTSRSTTRWESGGFIRLFAAFPAFAPDWDPIPLTHSC